MGEPTAWAHGDDVFVRHDQPAMGEPPWVKGRGTPGDVSEGRILDQNIASVDQTELPRARRVGVTVDPGGAVLVEDVSNTVGRVAPIGRLAMVGNGGRTRART